MAKIQFFRGLSTKWTQDSHAGGIYFTTDTNEIYAVKNGKKLVYGVPAQTITDLQNEDITGATYANDIITLTKKDKSTVTITIPLAVAGKSNGLMSKEDKQKLDNLTSGNNSVDNKITAAIEGLDSSTAALTEGNVLTGVTIENGKINGRSERQLVHTSDDILTLAADGVKSTITLAKISEGLGANVKEAYELQGNNGSKLGERINIYKDRSLKSVKLVTKNGSQQPGQFLELIYYTDMGEGTVETPVYVDVSALLSDSEFGNGLQKSEAGAISVKINKTGDGKYLTIGEAGIGLKDITTGFTNAKTAINTVEAPSTAETVGHIAVTKATNGHDTYTIKGYDIASAATLSTVQGTANTAAADITKIKGDGWSNETIKGNAADITKIKGDGWSNETIKGNADEITKIKGDRWSNETIKGNADDISALTTKISDYDTVKSNLTAVTKSSDANTASIGTINSNITKINSNIEILSENDKYLQTKIGEVVGEGMAIKNGTITYTGTNYLNDQVNLMAADKILDGKIATINGEGPGSFKKYTDDALAWVEVI